VSDKFFPTKKLALRAILYLWAAPNSMLGMLVGGIGLCCGGGVIVRRGCLEFYGGLSQVLLARLGGVVAMTLGHTVLGQTATGLDLVRDHEQVHVRQYERWGPFFIPAYLSCSTWMWWRGKDAYRDNPFEVEAYRLSDPSRRKKS
jgi:hypothetical protein